MVFRFSTNVVESYQTDWQGDVLSGIIVGFPVGLDGGSSVSMDPEERSWKVLEV